MSDTCKNCRSGNHKECIDSECFCATDMSHWGKPDESLFSAKQERIKQILRDAKL